MAFSPFREELRRAWRELRGTQGSAERIATAVALGLFIGSLPIFGLHTPLVIGLCIWFHLDGAIAWLAANISNPFFAWALVTAEIKLGARLRSGRNIEADIRSFADVAQFAGDLVVGAPVVALGIAAAGFGITYCATRLKRSFLPPRAPPAPYRLPDDAPPWVHAVERVAERYASPQARTPRERTRFHYVRTKLLGDPVARMIADLEGDLGAPLGEVVDIGTGRGQLPILLLELGRATIAQGFDWDETKIADASAAAAREPPLRAKFSREDAREGVIPSADTVLLIDLLHYFRVEEQDAILSRACDAVRPGGRIIVREADTERGVRSSLTLLEERLFTWIRFNRGERVRFRAAREIASALEGRGISCEVRPAWGRTPFSNVLIIGRRPAASG